MPMPPRPYNLMAALGTEDPSNPLVDQLGGQPFYSPENGISQDGYAYMGDLGAALLAGSGWRAGPADFGSNFGQAMQSANESHSDRLRDQMRQRLAGYELKRQQRQDAIEERERKAAEAAAAEQAAYVAQLPPEMQAAYRFAPDEFGKRLAGQIMPDAPKPTSEIAQVQADVAAGFITPAQGEAQIRKLTYIAPQAAREDPLMVVQTPDGPRYVPRSQAVGMAPGQTGENLQLVDVFDPKLGRNVKLPEQQGIGMEPARSAAGNEPLVEIFDKDSPTGTRFVSRAEAQGQPGKPSSNGVTLFDPATGQPIAQMGGRQTDFMPDGRGGQMATPGGKSDQISPDEAGKLAGRAVGARALADIIPQIIAPDGSVNRMLLGNMEVPLPWSPGRTANQAFAEAAEAKLRALTGAAAPDAEQERLKTIITPSVWDSDEAVKLKIARAEKFLSLSGSRNFSDILAEIEGNPRREPSVGNAAPAQPPPPGGNLYDGVPGAQPMPAPAGVIPEPKSAAERAALPPGTQYRAPDGSIRTR